MKHLEPKSAHFRNSLDLAVALDTPGSLHALLSISDKLLSRFEERSRHKQGSRIMPTCRLHKP